LAAGTFTIQVGSAQANTITIDNTTNTLDGLAAAITNLNIGVTASVVNDASGARLAIVSNTSGAASDLTIANVDSGLSFTKGATGTNDSLTVDGVPISTESNSISNTVAGLTLNLAGADPNTQVQIAVAPDTTKATQAVTDFVMADLFLCSRLRSQSPNWPRVAKTWAPGPCSSEKKDSATPCSPRPSSFMTIPRSLRKVPETCLTGPRSMRFFPCASCL
jgi:flagellar hook-associated protein 2